MLSSHQAKCPHPKKTLLVRIGVMLYIVAVCPEHWRVERLVAWECHFSLVQLWGVPLHAKTE
eukprot:1645499-Amphidinium_carterae.1